MLVLPSRTLIQPSGMVVFGGPPPGGGGGYTLQDNVGTTDSDFDSFGTTAGREYIGMSWVAGSSYTLTLVIPKMQKSGSPTQTLTGYIYSGVANLPGVVLATSTNTIAASSLVASPGDYIGTGFMFAGLALTNAVQYHFVMQSSANNASNFPQWRYVPSGASGFSSFSADGALWGNDESSVQGTFKTYSGG